MDTQLIFPQEQWWPSPAKLNLFLHILGRYKNGYHRLQTLFQMLDIGDRLHFSVNDSGEVLLATAIPDVPHDDNLIVRAAKLLQVSSHRLNSGVTIHLDKQLPLGGGIGGGSSNAATALVALNHLWACGLNEDDLARLGLQLGADVPIFVRGQTAFAGGIGEDIFPVTLPTCWYLVVYPGVHVSTADVFNDPALPRNTPPMQWKSYGFAETHNDCQQIVCDRYPEVAKLLRWLVHYAPSRMTGTGACVFATFSDEKSASLVQASLPSPWKGFLAKGVNRSPLKQKIDEVNATSDIN